MSEVRRKVITAIFADLVGSTGLTERLDPEEAREVVGLFYTTVQQAVERFEGTVANLLGDAVLAVFGLPVAHEDDPERAVGAGLTMRDAMAGLNERLAADYGLDLAVRVGINTGEVVAASGVTFDRDFLIADAVTTAARIQQAVQPGTVVVGERTYRLIRQRFECQELPPLEVKGKTAPLRVWEVVAPLPARQEAAGVASPLVDRQIELEVLRQLFERSRSEGLVHLVTVVGQPGIGKSRLLREFLADAARTEPPPLVLRGRSPAFGGQIGYHALLDILREQGGLQDTDASEAVRAKLNEWLRRVLPDHPGLLDGLLVTFGMTKGAPADPEQLRRELLAAWRTLLFGLAASRPVVAVFEDVHWADDGVLDLIDSLVTGADSVALYLVCLSRPELLERRPHWGGGRRNAMTIDLRPLRLQQTRQLVDAMGPSLTPQMQETIAQRAEGNPLFAEELVRMFADRAEADRAATADATVPDTVQAVITARIDRLRPEERRALQAAAVIGRTFWPSAVAELAALSVEEARHAIQLLMAKDLVAGHQSSTIAGETEYAFRQTLTRDVAYGMLPRSQRQRAHALAARWLEERLGERAEEAIEVLAEHFRTAGDHAKAAAYLQRAAAKARRLYANHDAIRLYDQALEAASKASLAEQIPRIALGRGEVHQLLGRYPAALADLEMGLAVAQQTGDRALEVVLEHRIGFVHHREARLEEAEAHFTRAAELARAQGDRQTLGLSLVDLATVNWDRGCMPAADRILTEGITLLRDLGDRSSLARALNLRCMLHLALGNGAEALAAAQEALVTAREAGDRSREATSLSYLSVVHNWLGRSRVGIEYATAALAIAESIGDRRRMAYAKEFLTQALTDLGEWGEGIRLTLEYLPLAYEVTPQELLFCYTFLGLMYYEIGVWDRAREAFRTAATFPTSSPGWRKVSLMAMAYVARLDQDLHALHQVLDQLLPLPAGQFVPTDGAVILPIAEALRDAGRLDDLRGFLANHGPVIERLAAPPHLAALDSAKALLALRDGDRHAARAHLDEAVRLAESCEHVVTIRRAREVRLEAFNTEEDRQALRGLYARIADGLPDDLREVFLASPRVAPIVGGV
ncbi:MAG: adenylate/guanylate cyclase domain-containing protein [Armatimonadota bacterium]|nr:adenylate/guanylate cyclase domain-containing protein [Armatimonadota bacterium]